MILVVYSSLRLRWIFMRMVINERRMWIRPVASERPPVRGWMDMLPAETELALLRAVIVGILGLAILGGGFVPGTLPYVEELLIGALLTLIWWISIQIGRSKSRPD